MIPETDDIFSLSQFVDQLSGMPMFMPPGGDGDGGGDAERPGEIKDEEKKDASSSASAPQIAVINGDEAATSLPKRPPPELTALPAMEETVVPGKKKKERVVVGWGASGAKAGDATNNIGIISDYIRRSRRMSALSWYSTFYEAAASEEEEDDGGGTGRHLLRREVLSLFADLDGEGGSRVSEGATFNRSEQSLDVQTSLSTEERLRRGEKVMEVAVNYCLVVESTENREDLKRAMKGGHKSTPMRRKHRGMNNIGSDTSTCSADEVAISEFDEESDGFDEWKLRLMRLLGAASLSSTTDNSGPGAASAAASATASIA